MNKVCMPEAGGSRVMRMAKLIEKRSKASKQPTDFPNSILSVIQHLSNVHRGRLAFTKGAIESAKVAQINEVSGGAAIALRVLSSMTELLNLHSSWSTVRDLCRIPQTFRERTGLVVGPSGRERSAIRDDPHRRSRRLELYQGERIDFVNYVRWGDQVPDLLCVHYAVLIPPGSIVIGHCGDDIDTCSTRRCDA